MNFMLETLDNSVAMSCPTDEERAIAAVLHAETQAFVDADFETWSSYFVHAERTTELFVNSATGLSVARGWSEIAARTRHALQNNLGCGMIRFRQENHQSRIEGSTAWVMFDGWAEDRNGYTWDKFETRILERGPRGWKIVFSSTVEKSIGEPAHDSLSVDKNGNVIWATPQTLEKIKEHPFLTISAGHIRARRRNWDKVLQEAVKEAGQYHGFYELRSFATQTGGPFCYPAVLGDTDDGGVAVVTISVRNGATQLQIDTEELIQRRLTVAQAVFKLSDGQVKIARHIAEGAGLKSIAETLGMSVNTARTHLSRLYEKTGVNSQTALVRLLLSVG